MAALPYIQLYVADYLADTMHLSTEEHGAYLLIIFNYWQTSGPIPKNRLKAISRVFNDRWTDVERSLSEYFNDTGTHWQHDRLDEDLRKVSAKQSDAVKAGKASAEARKSKKKALISSDLNGCSTGVEVSLQREGNHTDTDTDTDTKKDLCVFDFENFWSLYPRQRRGDKQKSLLAYKRAIKKDTPENIYRGLETYACSDEVTKGYAKGCEAWLNDSRWLNEYKKDTTTSKQSFVNQKNYNEGIEEWNNGSF